MEKTLYKIHDDFPSQRRSCLILLEFISCASENDALNRGVLEKMVFDKYRELENIDGEWSVDFVKEKLQKHCENFYLKLNGNSYESMPRLSCDLELIKCLVEKFRDKQTDNELKAKLTMLLERV